MSYYRWSSSNWYIFWCSSLTEDINEELLACWWSFDEQPNVPRRELPLPEYSHVDVWLEEKFPDGFQHMTFRDKTEMVIAIKEFLEDTDVRYAEKLRDRIASADDGLCGTEVRAEDSNN